MDLSERRAINVSLVLTERGMKAKSMKYSFQGEDNPATPTKDGVRSDNNRRVEAVFKYIGF